MMLYISGSFPYSQEGIADGAQFLYDAFSNVYKKDVYLVSTNIPLIKKYVNERQYSNYSLFNNWKLRICNISQFIQLLENVEIVHLEYPGDCYGKTFLASWIPLIVKIYNLRRKDKIKVCVRLHEFTKSRLLRKIADLPIIVFSDLITMPAQADRNAVRRICVNKNKVQSILMWSNIPMLYQKKNRNDSYIQISYFGGVYHNKGIEHLLRVWKQIHCEDSAGIYKFKIIGEINPNNNNHFAEYHKQVVQWIEEYGLQDVIEITGYVSREQASKEIANTDIGMMLYDDGLSLRRGSLFPFLEHGIPVITTYGDESCKKVFASDSGVFMTENDQEIYKALEKLSDFECRVKAGEANKRISKLFDWNQIARDTLAMYGVPNEDILNEEIG